MSQIIPIYIPTYISDATYAPARVLPRLLFYNGLIDCEPFYIESGSLTNSGNIKEQTAFPYFDNYNVVTGSFPTTGSKSLLFNNELASYGTIPTGSLYTDYWETYISLLYNPKTRLLTCEAIIPLADYTKMELNDVVNFRGNYYHLRAINDYSLITGECTLQLLGPIIPDTLSDLQPIPPAPPAQDATASIKLAEYNESPTAFLDANLIVSGTSYFFSGDFTQYISGGATANVTLEGKSAASTNWGPYKTGSATLTIRENGTLLHSSSVLFFSGSTDGDITLPITFTAGNTFQITGSTAPVTTPITGYLIENCDTAAQLKVSFSGGGRPTEDVFVSSDIPTGGCWNILSTTTDTLDYSNIVNDGEFVDCATCLAPPTATLDWSFSITAGPTATMDIYVNSSVVESRSTTSNGLWTGLVEGDTISVEVNASGCTGGSNYANVYCTGILNDAACNVGTAGITTTTYTVTSGDLGTTLTLDCFADCQSGCI